MQSQTTAITLLTLFQIKEGDIDCYESQLLKVESLDQHIVELDLDMKNLEEKHKHDQATMVEKEKSLNLLYKTKACSINRMKKSSSTPTTITAIIADSNINTSSLTSNNKDTDDDNGEIEKNSINNNDEAGTTLINNNNNTVTTASTATNKPTVMKLSQPHKLIPKITIK